MESSLTPVPLHRRYPMLIVAVVVGGLFYLVGQYIASQPQRAEQEVAAGREITVEGEALKHVRPDVARLTLGVTTGPQSTAEAALKVLTDRFDAVVARVESLGVEEDDITTTNLSLTPVYDFSAGRQQLRGFEATESITVKIRDLARVGEVLTQAAAEGVNQAGGIQFEVDDPTQLTNETEALAIEDAQDKATTLARALGVRLGRVKAFRVGEAGVPTPPPLYARSSELSADAGGGDLPVPSGTQELKVTVSVTYELK